MTTVEIHVWDASPDGGVIGHETSECDGRSCREVVGRFYRVVDDFDTMIDPDDVIVVDRETGEVIA